MLALEEAILTDDVAKIDSGMRNRRVIRYEKVRMGIPSTNKYL